MVYTAWPRLSETFLRREAAGMRASGHLDLYGCGLYDTKPAGEPLPVESFGLWRLWLLLLWLPWWMVRKPRAITRILAALREHRVPTWKNLGENLLGLGAGLVRARSLERQGTRCIHATWATAPGAFGWMVQALTGIPFTLGAHAYDLHQHGGDGLLREKLARAALIHTSTEAAAQHLRALQVPAERIALIRRGLPLEEFPWKPCRPRPEQPMRLLAVGRLVPKKRFDRLLQMAAIWRDCSWAFELEIVGAGPEHPRLAALIDRLDLGACVRLPGPLPGPEVARRMQQSHVFVFTGGVARDGDRDGLPNVVPEAMASGLVVAASPSPAIAEAIQDQRTGFLVQPDEATGWLRVLRLIQRGGPPLDAIRRAAREWVEAHFDARTNGRALAEAIARTLDAPPRTCPPQVREPSRCLWWDVTKSRHAPASGLARVNRQLLKALSRESPWPVLPVAWDGPARCWRAAAATIPTRADTRRAMGAPFAWITTEVFAPRERAGFTAWLAAFEGRKAALCHDLIPLRHPEWTWPHSVARHPEYVHMLARMDAIWAVSKASMDDLRAYWEWLDVASAPIRLLPLGADLDGRPRPEAVQPASDPPELLFVGILEPRKNIPALLQAADMLWSEGYRFHLRLCGRINPVFGKPIAQRITHLRRAGRPIIHHRQLGDGRLRQHLRHASLTLLPSIAEGYGLPVGESLWLGTPALVSPQAALLEWRGPGVLVAKGFEAEPLADALRTFLMHTETQHHLRDQAQTRPLPSWRDTARVLIADLTREPALSLAPERTPAHLYSAC